jgi:hypothetical protein
MDVELSAVPLRRDWQRRTAEREAEPVVLRNVRRPAAFIRES